MGVIRDIASAHYNNVLTNMGPQELVYMYVNGVYYKSVTMCRAAMILCFAVAM